MKDIQQLIQTFSSTKDRKIYDNIKECLKTQEKLWIAFSPSTNNYYLDYVKGSPSVFVFSKREYCEMFKDYLLQQYIEIEVIENDLAARVRTFGDFYRSGFETIIIDNGQTFLNMSLFDVIEKPDFSGLSEAKKPVINPQLVCAANRFFQALSRKKADRNMEYSMLSEIYKGKYLLPVDTSDMKIDDTSDKTKINEKSVISIPSVTRQDGKKFIPVFTDWNEMAKYDKNGKFTGFIASFNDIEYFCKNGDLVAINPFGINVTIDSNTVNVIKSLMQGSEKQTDEEKVTVFDLDVYPEKMIECLNDHFSKYDNVNAAYIRGMRRGEIAGYLIVVDFDGEEKSIFGRIAEIVQPHTEGLPVDFAKYQSEFGKNAAANTIPFYQRIKL